LYTYQLDFDSISFVGRILASNQNWENFTVE
jgi:hypothetical protein